MRLEFHQFSLGVDFSRGLITSMIIRGKERVVEPSVLFRVRLRDREGKCVLLTPHDAAFCQIVEDGARYGGFQPDISVSVRLTNEGGEAAWRIKIIPASDQYLVEWVEFPSVTLPALEDNNSLGTGGKILFPYNEGALISDMDKREGSFLCYRESEYPSMGTYAVFPNMVFAQMLAYLWSDAGLYMGAHDEKRGVKDLNFLPSGNGVTLRFKHFCGVDFGEGFDMNYPIVFSVVDEAWESAAERYRQWFEQHLPERTKKISENRALPAWYADSPLVVSYPVRGTHDMDEMKPNKLYPYTSALPILAQIREACDSRLLVLLMHWEGTAPWAPPYVWPPYGGVEQFDAFKEKLHEQGDLLGVYCSGFGYTLQSNLIDSYEKRSEYAQKALWRGMCADADGEVRISNICTGQRSGYDICPASKVGAQLLEEAYGELLKSGIDYAQILDQNHGGGQYFCYSREHGHPPAPGAWMTERMQTLLAGWNDTAPDMLLGCESAAAEPFIGNLRFSDNRFELNYFIGTPVPLYSYVYHEYLRNFMGNQVACPLSEYEDENLLYRIAYSFSSGDAMTLVIDENGQIRTGWGKRKTDHVPDKEKILRLVKNLTAFYREQAKPYLYNGRMIAPPAVVCDTVAFSRSNGSSQVVLPAILGTAWEAEDGSRALILVNPADREAVCRVNEKQIPIPGLNAIKVPLLDAKI